MASYPQNIINKFGGLRSMSRLTGYPASTIGSWLARSAIHDDHKPTLLKAAQENDIPLGPEDFFPFTEARSDAVDLSTDGVAPTAAR